MPAIDVPAIRHQFPALSITEAGRPVAFFDGPGGTQVPNRVIDAMTRYFRTMNANHGGHFLTSERSDAMLARAHEAVADLLNADADEVKFGANMTTLNFALSRSIGATLATGDEVVVTRLDHEANVGPWQALAADRDVVVRFVDIREDDVTMGHEATVSKISADQLFYLMSRGMTEDEAMATIVRGFVEPIARELPMEYAIEFNRLVKLEMEGSLG